MGIVNGISNAMGIVVPMVVAALVDGNVSIKTIVWDSRITTKYVTRIIK